MISGDDKIPGRWKDEEAFSGLPVQWCVCRDAFAHSGAEGASERTSESLRQTLSTGTVRMRWCLLRSSFLNVSIILFIAQKEVYFYTCE